MILEPYQCLCHSLRLHPWASFHRANVISLSPLVTSAHVVTLDTMVSAALCLGPLCLCGITYIIVFCLGHESMVLQGLLMMRQHLLSLLAEIMMGFLCSCHGLL